MWFRQFTCRLRKAVPFPNTGDPWVNTVHLKFDHFVFGFVGKSEPVIFSGSWQGLAFVMSNPVQSLLLCGIVFDTTGGRING
jgi:hypothetical protein